MDVAIHSVAKRDSNAPYLIANEIIALELGKLIDLPVVSGIPISGVPDSDDSQGPKQNNTYWASLSVGDELPPGDSVSIGGVTTPVQDRKDRGGSTTSDQNQL